MSNFSPRSNRLIKRVKSDTTEDVARIEKLKAKYPITKDIGRLTSEDLLHLATARQKVEARRVDVEMGSMTHASEV